MGEVISFAQMCDPPLKTGNYQIEVTPVTTIKCQLASEIIDFTVATERFSLPPDQIYSVYPPREAVGSYTECLPHIVLNRRTLPWEKTLLDSRPDMPWLALLVFHEAEGVEMVEGTCQQALSPEAGIYVPSLTLHQYEKPDAPCTYLHIPVDLLAGILPYAEALALLSHGKGVSLDNKVTDAAVNDNWFATVVSNRFCLEPADEQQTLRHIACLVSLEGYEACLLNEQDRSRALAHCSSARMIVLANWSFSMAKSAFDFGSTFSALDAAMLSTPYAGSNEQVQQLCRLGYLPLNHHIRDGSENVSWYQSPFIPYAEPRNKPQYARFADQLLAYDPEIGMMDIRYASAWQLGKSLALADQAYAQKLYAWRQSNQTLARTSVYHGLLQMHLSPHNANKSLADWQDEPFIGHQFVRAARANVNNDQANDEHDIVNNKENSDHSTALDKPLSGKQALSQQLRQRYKSLLSEVMGDESEE